MADISMNANDLSEEPVVVLHFDEEQTDVSAYNNLAKHISDQFRDYDFEMGPTRKAYALDVISDIPEPAVEWAYFVVKEISVLAIFEYLRRNFAEDSDEDSDKVEDITIKTESGDVVIEAMTMMSAREAKEVTGHFELLAEGGSLERYYGDDEEIMEKYGDKTKEDKNDENSANE